MRLAPLFGLLLLAGCAGKAPAPQTDAAAPAPADGPEAAPAAGDAIPAYVSAAVNAPDRAEADKALDEGRHPETLLTYYDVEPGMKVAEMMAGGGYTAELLARTVGPEGAVYGVNSPFVLERFAAGPWADRLAKPVNANVTGLDREFDDPFPPEVKDLDRVFSILVYHDFFWMGKDVDAMNKAIFDALKPGGIYAVLDHSAADGHGTDDVESLHRIEQSVVKAQVEAAGFTYVGESDAWRNPEDTRDWSASPRAAGERRGTSDRFAMTFVKP